MALCNEGRLRNRNPTNRRITTSTAVARRGRVYYSYAAAVRSRARKKVEQACTRSVDSDAGARAETCPPTRITAMRGAVMRTTPPASPLQSPVAAKKLPQGDDDRDDEYAELRTFLASIECSKYTAVLQDNEVTLGALLHFSEDDLKTLGIPLGPSIRIVRSLKTRAPEDGHGEVELEGSCETTAAGR